MQHRLRALLRDVPAIAITTDCWSGAARGYLGVTAHWIDGDWQLHARCLAVRQIGGSQNNESLAELLHVVLSEFAILPAKVVAIVTDNVSVMPAMVARAHAARAASLALRTAHRGDGAHLRRCRS